jgi:acetate kinase
LLNWLDEGGCHNVPRLSDLDAVGHRVVHGADRFTESIFIDAEVISGIEALEDLAPLHNAPAVDVIHASRDVLATAIYVRRFRYRFSLPFASAGEQPITAV